MKERKMTHGNIVNCSNFCPYTFPDWIWYGSWIISSLMCYNILENHSIIIVAI